MSSAMEMTIKATNIEELNKLRLQVVKEMRDNPNLLTVWQAKYWRYYGNEQRR